MFCFQHITAQQELNYAITTVDGVQQFTSGTVTSIAISNNSCVEQIEGHDITVGERFVLVQIFDEMENNRGMLIFDKSGTQINYDVVQEERKKYYPFFNCCINVVELANKLYFWDWVENDKTKTPYDCYYDSQSETSTLVIPRYYIFDCDTNTVETIILEKPCDELVRDGKLLCS